MNQIVQIYPLFTRLNQPSTCLLQASEDEDTCVKVILLQNSQSGGNNKNEEM